MGGVRGAQGVSCGVFRRQGHEGKLAAMPKEGTLSEERKKDKPKTGHQGVLATE